ncbi:hypothetical protein EDD86DRAFT_199257 [Gorgonomyces haynaldii]|nr:hypothetical protein EDD86DRAFT_199257 [Gorgonomyces haynaldii]
MNLHQEDLIIESILTAERTLNKRYTTSIVPEMQTNVKKRISTSSLDYELLEDLNQSSMKAVLEEDDWLFDDSKSTISTEDKPLPQPPLPPRDSPELPPPPLPPRHDSPPVLPRIDSSTSILSDMSHLSLVNSPNSPSLQSINSMDDSVIKRMGFLVSEMDQRDEPFKLPPPQRATSLIVKVPRRVDPGPSSAGETRRSVSFARSDDVSSYGTLRFRKDRKKKESPQLRPLRRMMSFASFSLSRSSSETTLVDDEPPNIQWVPVVYPKPLGPLRIANAEEDLKPLMISGNAQTLPKKRDLPSNYDPVVQAARNFMPPQDSAFVKLFKRASVMIKKSQ